MCCLRYSFLIAILFINVFTEDIIDNDVHNLIFHIVSGDGKNCSATLISENFMLTKASCLQEPFTAFAGPYNYEIDYTRKHPDFIINENEKIIMNDVALLKLVLPVMHASYRTIKLENLKDKVYNDKGINCHTGYWVYDSPESVSLRIIDIQDVMFMRCSEALLILNLTENSTSDICNKFLVSLSKPSENLVGVTDNALPLICDGQLFGILLAVDENRFGNTILSWLRVSGYEQWINSIIYQELYGVLPSEIPTELTVEPSEEITTTSVPITEEEENEITEKTTVKPWFYVKGIIPAIHQRSEQYGKYLGPPSKLYRPTGDKWLNATQGVLTGARMKEIKEKCSSNSFIYGNFLYRSWQSTSKVRPEKKKEVKPRFGFGGGPKGPPQSRRVDDYFYVTGYVTRYQRNNYYVYGHLKNSSTTEAWYDTAPTWIYVILCSVFLSLVVIATSMVLSAIIIKHWNL